MWLGVASILGAMKIASYARALVPGWAAEGYVSLGGMVFELARARRLEAGDPPRRLKSAGLRAATARC